MAAIDRLELVNFRSYAQAKIHFDGRPLAITGKNGAGKTNILEALSMFSPGRGLRRAEAEQIARIGAGVGWKLGLLGDGFRIENRAALGEPRQIVINDKSATQTAMGQLLRVIWMVPSQDRIWIDSASDRRKFFDRIVMSFTPDHAEAVIGYERALRERNRLLKDGVRDGHWYQAVEKPLAMHAKAIYRARVDAIARLNAEMVAAPGAFPIGELSLTYGDGIKADTDWPSFFAAMRPADLAAGTTKAGVHRVEFDARFVAKDQPAKLSSTGEQKALLIALILANARALIAEGARLVVLLDEVAAHLDNVRRRALFDALVALDAQIVMTGTEASLFDGLAARGDYLHIEEQMGASIIR